MGKSNQPVRLENAEGAFIISGNKLLLMQDSDVKAMSLTNLDLQKMKDAIGSIKPTHKKVEVNNG